MIPRTTKANFEGQGVGRMEIGRCSAIAAFFFPESLCRTRGLFSTLGYSSPIHQNIANRLVQWNRLATRSGLSMQASRDRILSTTRSVYKELANARVLELMFGVPIGPPYLALFGDYLSNQNDFAVNPNHLGLSSEVRESEYGNAPRSQVVVLANSQRETLSHTLIATA